MSLLKPRPDPTGGGRLDARALLFVLAAWLAPWQCQSGDRGEKRNQKELQYRENTQLFSGRSLMRGIGKVHLSGTQMARYVSTLAILLLAYFDPTSSWPLGLR